MVSAGEMYATRIVFLIVFDRSLLYAWVLNCIVASLGDLNATRICFCSMLRYACYTHEWVLTQQNI